MEKQAALAKIQPTILQAILDKKSKIELIRQFGNLTLAKVVKGNFPSIGSIKREHGIEKAETYAAVLIADLSHSFDGTLEEDHIREVTAELSSTSLANLSLEDLYVACRELKNNTKVYKLTVNSVLIHLNKYLDKRANEAAKVSLNNHLAKQFNDEDRMKDIQDFRSAQKRAVQKFNFEKDSKSPPTKKTN